MMRVALVPLWVCSMWPCSRCSGLGSESVACFWSQFTLPRVFILHCIVTVEPRFLAM